MTASNTKDCVREIIGHKIVGILFDALPLNRSDLARGTKALVLDDGRALVFHANGAFFMANQEDVTRAIQLRKKELLRTQADIAEVLALAGEPRHDH